MKTFLTCILLFGTAWGQTEPIKIGMSTALTGLASDIGQEMKLGVETYFAKVNAAGGVAGRPLTLIALDDKYEPLLAGRNVRQLIDNDQVLALIGNMGTPTATVTVLIINAKKILLFGALTGTELLRKTPPDRYVINFRASYEEETSAMIKGLLEAGIKPEEIAFFIQNDAYGDSGYQGAIKALKKAGYSTPEQLPLGRYTRNTWDIEEGLSQILESRKSPKAFILIGSYAPITKFIKFAKEHFPQALFLNTSSVGSASLARELGDKNENIIVMQVVPSLESAAQAIQDLKDRLTPVSLEGYLTAKLFVIGLQQAAASGKLDRQGIIDSFETMQDVDIGIGIKISFSKNNHQALTTVWPTILKDGNFVPLNWSALKK